MTKKADSPKPRKEKKKNFAALSIAMHKKHQGKIQTTSLVPLRTIHDLSLAYTPGVAAVCTKIANDKKQAMDLTMKGRTIAVVSDGSAVLGLGNIGPEAALPVMEGKAALFKEFANLDSVPIVLDTQDTEEIIKIVKAIAPGFGGINLEDISAPRCFEIERRLIKELDIPVMHDDQHGTAIVVLAGLKNALKIVKKNIKDVHIVFNGAGAAATATIDLLIRAGATAKNIVALDTKGIIHTIREDLNIEKRGLAELTNGRGISGGLEVAMKDSDVFIGMSKGGILNAKMVNSMADQPIVFALANPDPEITYDDAKKTKAAVVGTGRSDYPNQINNVLAFPGIFKGALAAKAAKITPEMKIAAADAIADCVKKGDLLKGVIVPPALDRNVATIVARAVAKAAKTK